jgi:VWFA-related protein
MDRVFRLLLVLLLPFSAVSGQNTAPPQLQPRTAESAKASPPAASTRPDRPITLDVQVTDKSGAPVRGLQQQDFTLLDDKQPQKIVSFQVVDAELVAASDPLVEIVLLVDVVNTSLRAVAYEREQVKKFLLQNGGKLAQPVSLIFFSDDGAKIQKDSSRDGNAEAALFDQYEAGVKSITRSQGFYGAADRFNLSLKTLNSLAEYEGKRPGRKLMIWLSRGWPLLSGPRLQFTNKDLQSLFDSIVATSTGLREAGVTLYSVDPAGVTNAGPLQNVYYESFLKGVTSPSKTLPGNLGLQVIAVQSGGRVFNGSNDLTTAIAACAADAASFYVLSFNSALPDQANEYHAIAVTVDKPGTTARTRTGYYAQP